MPIEAEQADGTVITVDTDQAVREDATLEGMADLKPAFKADGVITAGNSSPLNAGATSMLLMSKETAKKKGIKPWPPSVPSVLRVWILPSWDKVRFQPAKRLWIKPV